MRTAGYQTYLKWLLRCVKGVDDNIARLLADLMALAAPRPVLLVDPVDGTLEPLDGGRSGPPQRCDESAPPPVGGCRDGASLRVGGRGRSPARGAPGWWVDHASGGGAGGPSAKVGWQ